MLTLWATFFPQGSTPRAVKVCYGRPLKNALEKRQGGSIVGDFGDLLILLPTAAWSLERKLSYSFWRYCGAKGPPAEPSRAIGSRSFFSQRAYGLEESAGDSEALRITKAMVHQSKLKRNQRACITMAQLEHFCTLNRRYAYAFRAAFCGILRLRQLQKMRSGNFEAGEEPTLIVRKDKRSCQGRRPRRSQKHRKEVCFGELHVLDPMQEIFEAGTKMFNWLDEKRARALVKRAARKFKWPSRNIDYDGIHGGAREAKLRILGRRYRYRNASKCVLCVVCVCLCFFVCFFYLPLFQ